MSTKASYQYARRRHILTLGRLDIFLEILAWYACQRRVRSLLIRHPLFVISDLWRHAGKTAKRRTYEQKLLDYRDGLHPFSRKWFKMTDVVIDALWSKPMLDLAARIKSGDCWDESASPLPLSEQEGK